MKKRVRDSLVPRQLATETEVLFRAPDDCGESEAGAGGPSVAVSAGHAH